MLRLVLIARDLSQAWVTPDHYLHGNLTFLNVNLTLVSTEIGPINVGVLDSVISFFCKVL